MHTLPDPFTSPPGGGAPPSTPGAAADPIADAAPVGFTGLRGDFAWLVLIGGVLQLLTVGFYRFWLVTDIRRHLWRHTRLGPDAFEYTGTARELLIGFLFALAVLAPIYVLYFLAGLIAEEAEAFASLPLVLVLYVFGQYAAFRARRYRMTRTALRGLRFWMTGSGAAYAARAALWDAATVLTLGLAYPWRAAALERYKMRHTCYGDLAGDFVGTGWRLFLRGAWIWLVGLLAVAGTAVGAGALHAADAFGTLPAEAEMGVAGVLGLALLLVLLSLYPLFRATELRWRLEGVRFGPVALRCTLRRRTVLGCYAALLAATLLIAIAGTAVLGIAAVAMPDRFAGLAAGSTSGQLAAFMVIAVTYLAVLAAFGIAKRVFVDRGVWVAVVAATTVSGLAALDHVKAAGAAAGSLGEGLADALDVGAV